MEPVKREKKHKEKRRSNEKRKERSRDAARCRRSRETDIFTELAAALPVAPEQAAHLDKASVMRLAIAYLKVRAVVDSIPGPLAKAESSEEMDELFPKALNGFMLVLASDGNMVYLSENVSDYLGVSQMDMMGQSVYEYSHPCDHDELRECLSTKPIETDDDKRTYSFFLRLKCTLTSKGRKVNLKSASYKVIHCTGRLTYIRDSNSNITEIDNEKSSDEEFSEHGMGASLVLVGCPIPHPSNIEIPLGRDTFLSKHNLSMKFTYADEKLAEYLGWDSEELMGQSVFDFHHALDNLALDKSFKSLFSKGQCETVAYRFLGKRGGYAWVVTQATLIHCSKQHKPVSVVCVNYVLSGLEHEDEVYSVRQLAARNSSGVEQLNSPEEVSRVIPTSPEVLPAVCSPEEKEIVFSPAYEEQNRSPLALQENRVKPHVVTTSIFRQAAKRKEPEKDRENIEGTDGSRKEDTFPRPVLDVDNFLETFDESRKENDEPAAKRPNRVQIVRPEFVFQGKPALEYNPEIYRKNRAQSVTKQLFTPIADNIGQEQLDQLPPRPAPQTATASIFAPRTEDMNKGFLTFSEDQPGLTMLKDEPEDLTHLAPTPGDVCVPLEDTPFLSDMLDEFILTDNYCPLLSPDSALTQELQVTDLGDPLKSTDLAESTRNKNLPDPLADCDPFMYEDSPASPCSMDPNAVTSSLTEYRQISLSDSQSPERSIDSLGSPTECSAGEGLSEDEMLILGIGDGLRDDEMSLRAPYIPMSDQDEALELLINDDMIMWGADNKTSSKWLIDEKEDRISDSSLAQLLHTDQIGTRGYNDHGGGLVNPAQVLGQIPRKNAFLESNRWSTKSNRTDKPSKRIHNSSSELCNENKRIKCEESSAINDPLNLEDHFLDRQSVRKASITGSPLLRRLVSQQTVPRNGYSSGLPVDNARRNEVDRNGLRSERDESIDVSMIKSDERRCYDGLNGLQSTNTTTDRSQPPCNSVLMNLLVSGCDDSSMDSRNVPSLPRKDLTTPLTCVVDLDNQTVPQLPSNSSSTSMNLGHLSPDIRKQLTNSFMNGAMPSPPTSMLPFDCLDYDVANGGTGLLQVGTDLFGSLLDRNLV